MSYRKLLKQMIGVMLTTLLVIGCDTSTAIPVLEDALSTPIPGVTNNPDDESSKSQTATLSPISENGELSGAINIGYSLGILASTYAPWIPEYADSEEVREEYSLVLQASVLLLDIQLIPDPASLVSAGRGQPQYDVIESYFKQIGDNTLKKSSPCIRNLVGMSLASGWLELNTFEVEQINVPEDVDFFKEHFLGRLSDFLAFAGTAEIFCEKEDQKEISGQLSTVSDEGKKWEERIFLAGDYELIDEVKNFRNDLHKWIAAIGTN